MKRKKNPQRKESLFERELNERVRNNTECLGKLMEYLFRNKDVKKTGDEILREALLAPKEYIQEGHEKARKLIRGKEIDIIKDVRDRLTDLRVGEWMKGKELEVRISKKLTEMEFDLRTVLHNIGK